MTRVKPLSGQPQHASHCGDVALPPVCGGSLGDDSDHLGLQAEELIAPFVAVPATPRVLPPSEAGTLRFRLASVNVLSLLGAAGKSRDAKPVGLAMQVAKPALFSQALDKSRVDAAAVQETRFHTHRSLHSFLLWP